jgi:Xaa-Pro dipeptidase
VLSELDDKTERVARLARESDLSGILLTTQTNFAWLTGGGSNRIDGSREPGAGNLFVTADGRRFVIANTIEMPRLLAEELGDGGWQPLEYAWTDEHARPETVTRLAQRAAGGDRIGADWPVAAAIAIDRPITRARNLLTPPEIERYLRLGADAGRVLGEVCRNLEPGEDERAIAARTAAAIATVGARAVVTLVAADDRITRFRHPVAGTRRWERLVMVVLGAQRAGLIVSLSRIVCAGRVQASMRELTEATAGVFGRLLEATRPGASSSPWHSRPTRRQGFPAKRRNITRVGRPDTEPASGSHTRRARKRCRPGRHSPGTRASPAPKSRRLPCSTKPVCG